MIHKNYSNKINSVVDSSNNIKASSKTITKGIIGSGVLAAGKEFVSFLNVFGQIVIQGRGLVPDI